MLIRDKVEHAVRLQGKGYRLLKWLEKALTEGFIRPEAAGGYASSGEGAYAWLDRHYLSIPADARPDRADLRAFGNLFSTYLESTFNLDPRPSHKLYSEHAHCFCYICSWMVQKPHLTAKRVDLADKRRAERMKRSTLLGLAASRGMTVADETLDAMLQNPDLREPIGLCAYTVDLLHRLEGQAAGAATLVLWRSFAWTIQGSPKPKFVLTTDAIMAAQDLLIDRLCTAPR